MKLTNLANTFTIFGNFPVFEEDNVSIINKVYSDCNISINNEPTKDPNKPSRLMQISDPKKHITIYLRTNRIDVQAPGVDYLNKTKLLADTSDIFKAFSQMFNEWGTRIAYVGSYFIFDDNDEVLHKVSSLLNILPSESHMAEVNLRINSIETLNNETYNNVFNVNNVRIGASNNPSERRKALMFTFDINTIASNNEERFNIHELSPLYEELYNYTYSKIEELQEKLS